MAAIHSGSMSEQAFSNSTDIQLIVGLSSHPGSKSYLLNTSLGRMAARLSGQGEEVVPIVCDPVFFHALPFEVQIQKTGSDDEATIPRVSSIGMVDGVTHSQRLRRRLTGVQDFIADHPEQMFAHIVLVAYSAEKRQINKYAGQLGLYFSELPETASYTNVLTKRQRVQATANRISDSSIESLIAVKKSLRFSR